MTGCATAAATTRVVIRTGGEGGSGFCGAGLAVGRGQAAPSRPPDDFLTADAIPQKDGLLWSARSAPASLGSADSTLAALTGVVAASESSTGVVCDDWVPRRAAGVQSHPFGTPTVALTATAAPHASTRTA